MATQTISTQRLKLRRWQKSYEAPFATLCADPEVKRFIGSGIVMMGKRRFCGVAMKLIGNDGRQITGRWLNNRVENSHLPLRTLEHAMLRFRQMRSLQKFASIHASAYNQFNQQPYFYSRENFKLNRTTALAYWRRLGAA